MNYLGDKREIERALARADEEGTRVSERRGERTSVLKDVSSLKLVHDYYPVQLPQAKPNQVYLPDIEQLRYAYRYALERFTGSKNEDRVTDAVNHELAHAEAARLLGYHAIFLLTFRAESFHPSTKLINPDNRTVFKLGVASITAAPSRLSGSDYARIQAMGYKSILQLGEEIVEFNRRVSAMKLQVPGSYGVEEVY